MRAFLLKAVALLLAPVNLLTAALTARTAAPPRPGATLPQYADHFGLFQAVPRYQGVTTDGTNWYYSWNYGLLKTDMAHNPVAENFIAIPPRYLFAGSNHIGGISYWNGHLYCPLEDGSGYQRPYILIYNAQTLQWTGVAYALPQQLHTQGVPWVAVDGPRGVAYTAEWSGAAVLNVFSLRDFTLLRTVPLSVPLNRIQGAEVYRGLLYCAADTKDAHTVWAVNPLTGRVTKVFDRVLDNAVEAEDMTVFPLPDGTLFHCLETGASRVDVLLAHYAAP